MSWAGAFCFYPCICYTLAKLNFKGRAHEKVLGDRLRVLEARYPASKHPTLNTMTKDGLVEAVMKATGMETKAAAQRAVEAVIDTITKTMARGEDVAITGFGTFRIVKRAAREGRNPKTGEKIQIKASIKPKFRAGKALKEAVL